MLAALLLAAAPVTIASKDALLDFDYNWSAEAAAVPELDRRFRADAARQKREALATAIEDRKSRAGSAFGWNGHLFWRGYDTAGQSNRLLSLQEGTATFTGGAHPNSGSGGLLWDRRRKREISIDTLLRRTGWWNEAIRRPFCVLLDRERAKKRGEPVKRTDFFGDCPELKSLTVVPADEDKDQRFDHIRVTADAYVAGPYVEAAYIITLPITAAMIARLKPEYRASFEPQPPVQ